jgi:hypothetical protein
MIPSDFTPEPSDALPSERFPHPPPRVPLQSEAVSLKSQRLPHPDICRLGRSSENPLRSDRRQVPEGGIERLKRTDGAGTESERDEHREPREDDFRKNPPRSTAQAAAAITRITGVRRGVTPVRKFLTGRGLSDRNLGMIPAKADADDQAKVLDEKLRPRLRQAQRLRRVGGFVEAAHFVPGPFLGSLGGVVRLLVRGPAGRTRFNVRGAIAAITPALTTVVNDPVIDAMAVCALLRALAAR